jgi:hypothetical protein
MQKAQKESAPLDTNSFLTDATAPEQPVQLFLRAPLPVGRDLDEFKWHRSFFRKYLSSGALPLNPGIVFVIRHFKTAPLQSLHFCARYRSVAIQSLSLRYLLCYSNPSKPSAP